MDPIERIRDKLHRLEALDSAHALFGASQHQYVLEPPITEERAERIETSLGFALPTGYRRFVREVGSGGAGPGYGLASLAILAGDSFVRDATGTPIPDREPEVGRPCPLRETWHVELPYPGFPEGSHPYDGCLLLGDIGCDYVYFLIVNGPGAGEVWHDYTAGDGEIGKDAPDFLTWYERWLDDALAGWALLRIQIETRDPCAPRPEVTALASGLTSELARAWLAIYERRFDAAEALLAPLVARSNVEDVSADLALAALRRQRSDFASALEVVARAQALSPRYVGFVEDLRREQAMALFGLGRRDEAIAIAKLLVRERPFIARNHFTLALVAGDEGAFIAPLAEAPMVYGETPGNVTFSADFIYVSTDPVEARMPRLRAAWEAVRARYGA